jgi:pimeloyl-ACP methyl ester carboxylesterase
MDRLGIAGDGRGSLYRLVESDDFSINGHPPLPSKPSWYAVSKLDKTIDPDLERFLAKRMNATTVGLNAGHLSLVSHPEEIANLILAAAGRRN